MRAQLNRRHFLQTCSASVAGVAGFVSWPSAVRAVEPFKRAGSPRMALSLAAYSFRDFFHGTNSKRAADAPPAKRIDLFQFIDYCADHGCAGTELTSYYFPKPVDATFLLKLRRHAFLRGIEVSGTAVGNIFTLPPGDKRAAEIDGVKQWIDHAAVLGAPHIRVFAGDAKGAAKEDAKRWCIEALEECAQYAGQKGVFLGVENHGGIVAEPQDLLDIVQAVKSPWVGINLDSANFHTDDPYRDLALCAAYAVNVQLKSEVAPRGQLKAPADLVRLVKILRDANYQGYVALEYEAAEDPWTAVPRLLKEIKSLLTS